jgi:methyl-accepting chemotaxis protein
MGMNIATRLWLPTLVITALLVAVGATMSLRTTSQINAAADRLTASEAKLIDASTWRGLTESNAVRVVSSLLSSDAALDAAMTAEIAETTARISDIEKRVDAAATDPQERAALDRIAETRKAYIAARDAAGQAKAGGDAAAAQALLGDKVQPAIGTHLAAQQAYVDLQLGHTAAVRAQSGAERMHLAWAALGVIVLVLGVLVVTTALTVRAICRPMDRLVDVARRIGDGDLDVEVATTRADELGAVQRALAAMRDALRGIVGQVRQSAESIQVASTEVASGNMDLSHRTEQTAGNLQQTASSLQQLTANVRQSADAAAQANQLAASAQTVAQRGGDVVSQVVSTMNEINASSKRIADIIGTIDGIAFQTNILALNAAVEAARAGEQGRGFAVVASEVRSLARRSAEAAREIKTLIGTSVEKVETGARLVQDAGSTMGEIVASVQRVTDVIGEITAAAAEQSQGIGQVNGAVANLDQMTQQNAALVEESAAAAESLKDQAQRLTESMQVFRLSGGAVHLGAAVPARPAPAAARPAPVVQTAPAKAGMAQAKAARPAPLATPARPPEVARAAIRQARETSRPVAPPSSDDWESF